MWVAERAEICWAEKCVREHATENFLPLAPCQLVWQERKVDGYADD